MLSGKRAVIEVSLYRYSRARRSAIGYPSVFTSDVYVFGGKISVIVNDKVEGVLIILLGGNISVGSTCIFVLVIKSYRKLIDIAEVGIFSL